MTLVDTSVWVDHLRRGNPILRDLLTVGYVECHAFVIGELACGHLTDRSETLLDLSRLPRLPDASHEEVLTLIESQHLMGKGLGWSDAHLLTAAAIAGTRLWTLDKRLKVAAQRIGIAE